MAVLSKDVRRAILRVAVRVEGRLIELADLLADEAGSETVELHHVEDALRQVLEEHGLLREELQKATGISHVERRAG